MRTLQMMRETIAKKNKMKFLDVLLLFVTMNALLNWIRGRETNKASDALVRSNPEYNNVFLLNGGELGFQGTAVYIGNNMLITAAHCLIRNLNEISKINENLHTFTFHETNAKCKIINTYHAKRIFIHPEYDETNDTVDLALIQLKENITHLKGLELNLERPRDNWSWLDAISIGYSRKMPPRNSLSHTGLFTRKIAVKIPQAIAFDQRNHLFNVLGYNIDRVQHKVHKRKYDPLENGLHCGMSGGPLLHNNKIIGINYAFNFYSLKSTNGTTSEIKEYLNQPNYKRFAKFFTFSHDIGCVFHLDGKIQKFTRLDSNKVWIQQILEQCRQSDKLNPREEAEPIKEAEPRTLLHSPVWLRHNFCCPIWQNQNLFRAPNMYEESSMRRMPPRQRC